MSGTTQSRDIERDFPRLYRGAPRRLIDAAAIGYAIMLAYLSFVPFDLTSAALVPTGPAWFGGLHTKVASKLDVAANLALYMVLGALAALAMRRRRWSGATTCLAVVGAATAMSLSIEYLQHFFKARVPSWIDVNANAVGALLGAIGLLLAERRIAGALARAEQRIRENPWMALAKAVVVLAVCAHLRPYDAFVDPRRLVENVRSFDASPTARWQALPERVERDVRAGRVAPEGALARARWEYVLNFASDSLSYALAAGLIVVGFSMQRRLSVRAVAASGLTVMGAAAIVTVVRTIMASHGFDSAHFVAGVAGWAAGSVAGAAIFRHHLETHPRRLVFAYSRVWVAGLVVVAVLVVGYGLAPLDFGDGAHDSWRLMLVPFEGAQKSRPLEALTDLSSKFLRFLLLGAATAIVLARTVESLRKQMMIGLALVAGLSIAVEIAHLFMPGRHSDITTVLLAGGGALLGTAAAHWIAVLELRLRYDVADDLLTTQLIEGPTYAGPLIPTRRRPRGDAFRKDRAESDRPREYSR